MAVAELVKDLHPQSLASFWYGPFSFIFSLLKQDMMIYTLSSLETSMQTGIHDTLYLARAVQEQIADKYCRSVTTHAAWRIIPTTYILCMNDKPSTVAAAQYLIETAKASGEHKIDNVIKHNVGHSPFISQPEWLAKRLIEEASREP